ncbi:10713_t:CDS:2, partial [Racocetra fulgida]
LNVDENGQSDKEYEVEAIINWKKENGKDYYKIKWLENLKNCTELLRQFRKSRATKRVTISDDDEYKDSAPEEKPVYQKRVDKIFKDDVDDDRKNDVFSRPVESSTQNECRESSNKTKNNRDRRLLAAIKFKKNRIASSSKVENDEPRRSNYVSLSSSPNNDVFISSLVTDLKKENLEASSIGSSSGNAPKISKKRRPRLLMHREIMPPWSPASSFEPLSRKLGEKSNTSMTSIENNNREELSQSVKKEHKELSQPVKKEPKEPANLMDTDDQCEPMLSPVPVRVRTDHQWQIRKTDRLVIEHVQLQKRLVKIIEHDAADYGKESGNEPFYAIYL